MRCKVTLKDGTVRVGKVVEKIMGRVYADYEKGISYGSHGPTRWGYLVRLEGENFNRLVEDGDVEIV